MCGISAFRFAQVSHGEFLISDGGDHHSICGRSFHVGCKLKERTLFELIPLVTYSTRTHILCSHEVLTER